MFSLFQHPQTSVFSSRLLGCATDNRQPSSHLCNDPPPTQICIQYPTAANDEGFPLPSGFQTVVEWRPNPFVDFNSCELALLKLNYYYSNRCFIACTINSHVQITSGKLLLRSKYISVVQLHNGAECGIFVTCKMRIHSAPSFRILDVTNIPHSALYTFPCTAHHGHSLPSPPSCVAKLIVGSWTIMRWDTPNALSK